jgi:hypothetical protein
VYINERHLFCGERRVWKSIRLLSVNDNTKYQHGLSGNFVISQRCCASCVDRGSDLLLDMMAGDKALKKLGGRLCVYGDHWQPVVSAVMDFWVRKMVVSFYIS